MLASKSVDVNQKTDAQFRTKNAMQIQHFRTFLHVRVSVAVCLGAKRLFPNTHVFGLRSCLLRKCFEKGLREGRRLVFGAYWKRMWHAEFFSEQTKGSMKNH